MGVMVDGLEMGLMEDGSEMGRPVAEVWAQHPVRSCCTRLIRPFNKPNKGVTCMDAEGRKGVKADSCA